MRFSVVVPVYNESGNLIKLHSELCGTMKTMGSYEIIYVNDGSNDGSLEILKKLKHCKIIDLQRNYGQSSALDAGFKEAIGEYIISLDADLQNDPKDIPKLYSKLISDKIDVVAGWRYKRKDPFYVRILTKIARFLRGILIKDNIHDTGCTLRIYTRRAIKSLDLWGEMHRYIIALLTWKGFKVDEIKVNHRKRYSGKTKYNAIKSVNGLTDLIYIWFINKYARRPLHLFGVLAYITFTIGFFIELVMLYLKITKNIDLSSNGLFGAGLFMIGLSVQFFVSGVIMDIQLRSYYNTSPVEQRYRIKDIIKK